MYIDRDRSVLHRSHAMRSNAIAVVRLRILSGLFVAVAILLVARLYFIQIVHGQEYRADAMGQYVSPETDTDTRSTIFFTDISGRLVAAAVMQSGWRIALTPKDITDAKKSYNAIHKVIPLDSVRFMASAQKKNDPYEEVAYRISDENAERHSADHY